LVCQNTNWCYHRIPCPFILFARYAPPSKRYSWSRELIDGAAGALEPCTEKDENGYPLYEAKTFTTTQIIDNGVEGQAPVTTQFIGIILCPTEGTKAVLEPGFAATDPTREKPSPDKYISVSGTLVHEMVHVVGQSRNKDCKFEKRFVNEMSKAYMI
jgi:hypothetical protein